MLIFFSEFKEYTASLGESLIIAVIIQSLMRLFGYSYEFIPQLIILLCIGYVAGLIFGTLLGRILTSYFDIK